MNTTKSLGICLSNLNGQVEKWFINAYAIEDAPLTIELLMDLSAMYGIEIVKTIYPKHYKYLT